MATDHCAPARSNAIPRPIPLAPPVINATNFPDNQRKIVLKDLRMGGLDNFTLELKWSGTALLPVNMPIIIEGEILKDATR